MFSLFPQTHVIDITFDKEEGPSGLLQTLNRICIEATKVAQNGYQIIILSDRKAGVDRYEEEKGSLHF